MYLMYAGRFHEPVQEIAKAHGLDPLSPMINANFGQILNYAGDHERATEMFKKAIELDPNLPYAHLHLGGQYLERGLIEEGMVELKKEIKISGKRNPAAKAFVGCVYALIGKVDVVREILEDVLRRSKKEYVSPYAIARLYFSLEDDDEGFKWLDRAYEESDHWLSFLKIHMSEETIGSDPRFAAMLKKIGLEK
jgi:tetratricopeptide (TPR) repeat protein